MASSLQTSGVLSSYFQTSIWENQTIKNGKSHFRATGLILSIPRKESLHMFESTTNLSTVKTLFRGAYGHRQKKPENFPILSRNPILHVVMHSWWTYGCSGNTGPFIHPKSGLAATTEVNQMLFFPPDRSKMKKYVSF